MLKRYQKNNIKVNSTDAKIKKNGLRFNVYYDMPKLNNFETIWLNSILQKNIWKWIVGIHS